MNTLNDESMNPAEPSPKKKLNGESQTVHDPEIPALGSEDAKRLPGESRIHQVEEEIKNGTLHKPQKLQEIPEGSQIDLNDLAPVGFLSVSKDGVILKANLTAATLLGFPRSLIIRQPFAKFIFPEDHEIYFHYLNHLNHLSALNTDGEPPNDPQPCELRILKKNVDSFWAQLDFTISRNSNDTPAFRIMLKDITRDKRVAKILRENKTRGSESRYRKLFIHHSAVILILDVESGKIVDANDSAIRFYGWPLNKLRQMYIWEINTLPADSVEKSMLQAAESGSGKFEFCHRRADGSIRDVEVYSTELKSGGNKFLVSIIHDITERKQYEKQLQTLNNELELRVEKRTHELQETQAHYLHAEKLSAIGKLSASIAHEVNNPMQGIMAILQGLQKRAILEEEDRELLDLAIVESKRIRDLIQILHDFNRPSPGQVEIMDIHRSLDALLILCKNEFRKRWVTVERHYAEQLPHVLVVQDQIKQVLLNLLTNAAEACGEPGGGMVKITTWREENWVAVSINDTGTGIAPDKIDQIFQPFYTTKAAVKGTGLGLSISYSIIQKHQGKIHVESKVGEGSTFTVLLPV